MTVGSDDVSNAVANCQQTRQQPSQTVSNAERQKTIGVREDCAFIGYFRDRRRELASSARFSMACREVLVFAHLIRIAQVVSDSNASDRRLSFRPCSEVPIFRWRFSRGQRKGESVGRAPGCRRSSCLRRTRENWWKPVHESGATERMTPTLLSPRRYR